MTNKEVLPTHSRRGRKWYRGHPSGQKFCSSPYQRTGSELESLPEGRVWLGATAGVLGVVGRPFLRAGNGREALAEGWEWSGGPPGGSRGSHVGLVGPPGSGQEALPDDREWSGVHTGEQGVVGRFYWRADWSGDSLGRPELVGRPSQSGREAHPEDMEALLEGREVLPEGLEPFRRAGSGGEAFLEGRERS